MAGTVHRILAGYGSPGSEQGLMWSRAGGVVLTVSGGEAVNRSPVYGCGTLSWWAQTEAAVGSRK